MMHERVFVLFALLSTGASAQWLNFPAQGTPRTRDGKPNLAAPAPRAPDGKPDLSGVWEPEPTSSSELSRVLGEHFSDLQLDQRGILHWRVARQDPGGRDGRFQWKELA